MAREVVTHVWCDVCLQEDNYSEAKELPPITLGGMKPRVLALCELHEKEVYQPIRELLTELGVVADSLHTGTKFPGTSPGSGVWPCPDPGCPKHTKPYKHEQSLRNHARDVHNVSITVLRKQFGPGGGGAPDEALFDEEDPGPAPAVTEAVCDVEGCDKVYAWPEIRYPAVALGVHKSKAHGIRSAEKARRKARKN